MRYASGALQFTVTDLKSDGFSLGWGHTRIYRNLPNNGGGSGWFVRQMPVLGIGMLGIRLFGVTDNTLWFPVDGSFSTPRMLYTEVSGFSIQLPHTGFPYYEVFNGNTGERYLFESDPVPHVAGRRLVAYFDPYGNGSTIAYDTYNRLSSVTTGTTPDQTVYSYEYPTGSFYGAPIQSVTLSVRGVNVRRVVYAFDGSSLKNVTRQTGCRHLRLGQHWRHLLPLLRCRRELRISRGPEVCHRRRSLRADARGDSASHAGKRF